jgi:hypothetical protein
MCQKYLLYFSMIISGKAWPDVMSNREITKGRLFNGALNVEISSAMCCIIFMASHLNV